MKINNSALNIVWLAVYFLCSCTFPPQGTGSQDRIDCIPPLESFSYSTGTDENKPIPGDTLTVAPPWQLITALPDQTSTLLASTQRNGEVEIWFKHFQGAAENDQAIRDFQIYYPKQRNWVTVSAEIEDSGLFVDQIYTSAGGEVWGVYDWESITSIDVELPPPLLSRFNENSEQFEFVKETESIPPFKEGKSDNWYYWSKILIGGDGIIWVLTPSDGIYSFNPNTLTTKRVADISELVVSHPVLSPDGTIYFMNLNFIRDGVTLLSSQDIQIYQFTPTDEKIKQVPTRFEPWPSVGTILVDRKGRLWADALYYQDGDGVWIQMERSPIFITNILWDGLEYRWKSPEVILASSDSRLWFRSDNGLAWLDLAEKKWCWFTTSKSGIVEDSNNDLWVTYGGNLYKTPLDK